MKSLLCKFFILECLLSCSWGFAEEDLNQKPFVTIGLHGQLGNQLHLIATTLAYAWDNDREPYFPDLLRSEFNLPMNFSKIFFRLNSDEPPRPILHKFEHRINFTKLNIPVLSDLRLDGYFQTWEYYHHHRDKLLHVFSLCDEDLNNLKLRHADLLNHPCTVGIHVRTFNPEWSRAFPFVALDYYAKAISLFPEDALFVVFSDRINWCKHHFSVFDRQMIFIEKQDHIEDFFLMSMLKHNIIGNSSYSWWAAYLNQNPNKKVIAPSHFIHPSLHHVTNANLPEWTTLDIDYNYQLAPYPNDIRDYDVVSSSIDTQ